MTILFFFLEKLNRQKIEKKNRKHSKNPTRFTNCFSKSAEQHMVSLWLHQRRSGFGYCTGHINPPFFPLHLLIKMECAVYALEGVGWNGMPREGERVGGGGGGSLMGKGTLVCGDTLMFNHKWPPDAGSHKPAPLLITSALKRRVHCTLSTEHLCKSPSNVKVTLL